MSTDSKDALRDSILTEEGKLRHENSFLKERVTNLEAFKKNFFAVQNDLIEAREKLAVYEEALNFNQIKDRIVTSHEEPVDEQLVSQTDDVLGFLHNSISANSFEDLVMSIFQSTNDLDLGVGIQIRYKKNIFNYALDETHKDSYNKFITEHKNHGSSFEKDNSIVHNQNYISIITTGLPDKNSIKGKQIRDFLEIVTLGANSRIDAIIQKSDLNELKVNIYKIFKKTNDSFSSIQDNLDNQIIAISELFLSFEENLMSTLKRTTLSSAHNELIKIIVHDAKSELNLVLTSSLTMDEHFMNVMDKLEKAYSPEK